MILGHQDIWIGKQIMPPKIATTTTSFAKYDDEPLRLLNDSGFEVVLNPYERRLNGDEVVELAADEVGIIACTEPLDKNVLEKLHHLNLFNPTPISYLLEKAGFVDIVVTTPGRLDWDIVEGMILRDELDLGRLWNTMARELGEKEKMVLQAWVVQSNLSSYMRVLARKQVI